MVNWKPFIHIYSFDKSYRNALNSGRQFGVFETESVYMVLKNIQPEGIHLSLSLSGCNTDKISIKKTNVLFSAKI